MKVLNHQELSEHSLLEHSKSNYFSKEGCLVEFPHSLRVRIPSCASRIPHLADFIVRYLGESNFCGSVFLLGASNIWSPEIDELGEHLYKKIIGQTVVPRAIVFNETDDIKDQIGILFIVLAFQWDAIFFPKNRGYCILASHDEYLELRCRELSIFNECSLKINQWLHG